MRKISYIITALALTSASLCFSSCYLRFSEKAKQDLKRNFNVISGTADLDSVTFRPGEFNAVEASGSMDITFIPTSEDPRVVVTTSENLIDSVIVETYPDGNDDAGLVKTLTIKYACQVNFVANHHAVIYYPSVSRITSNGSGDFEIAKGFKGDSLTITSQGSGDFKIRSMELSGNLVADSEGSGDFIAENLDVNSLVLRSFGSGDAFVTGKGEKASYSTNGSGDINAVRFIAKTSGSMSQNGSGTLKCTADGKVYTWDSGELKTEPADTRD